VNRITPPLVAPNHTFSQSGQRVLCMTNVAARYRRGNGTGLRFEMDMIIH